MMLAAPVMLSKAPRTPTSSSTQTRKAAVHGGYLIQPSVEAAGRPSVDIRPFLGRVSKRIKVPSGALAAAPVSAETVGAADLPRDRVGLAVLYHSGVHLTAEADGTPFDPPTKLAAASKETTGFADGRKAPFEIEDVDGVAVALQRGGVQTTRISGDITLNAAVEWQENGVTYTLQSDVVDANGLLGMMRSIHQQQ